MSKISDKIIDDVLQRCDIAEIIGAYIPLKKTGRNFKALCPFHHEKTPSFIVSTDKQIYHCFGCGAGGDVFNFVMKHERMEFPEAVRFLAGKVGITIVENETKSSLESASLTAMLYGVHESAAGYFQQNLLKEPRAEAARRYIASRGVAAESIARFRIGYSLDLWDGLLGFLRKKGISEKILLKSGLFVVNAQGGLYDRFRNRLMFPIFNSQGRIVGFGGRALEPVGGTSGQSQEKQPKYINSPETEIYVKSKNFYGLNFSKKNIADNDVCIVVEGYLDFVIPFQSGIGNLVASLGTAFTAEHVRVLKRYTHNVVILFDADEAGQEAALRSLDLLIEEEMNVRIAALGEGYDPDTYVREFGEQGFRSVVEQAKSIFDFKIERLMLRFDKNIPEEKARIAAEMLATIKKIKNSIVQNTHIKKLSELLTVDEDIIRAELRKMFEQPDVSRMREAVVAAEDQKGKITAIAEQMLLSMLFDDPRLLKRLKEVLSCDEFSDPLVRKITAHLFECKQEEVTAGVFLKKLDDQQITSFLSELLVTDLAIKDRPRTFDDCVRKIKRDSIQRRLDLLQKQIHAVHPADSTIMQKLLQQYDGLKKEQRAYEKGASKEN